MQTLTKLQFLLNEWHSFFGGFLILVLLTKLQYLANCVNSLFESFFAFTLEYLINVYDQLSVYGGNLGLDTHRVGI